MVSLRRLKLKARRIGLDVKEVEQCTTTSQVYDLINKIHKEIVSDELCK